MLRSLRACSGQSIKPRNFRLGRPANCKLQAASLPDRLEIHIFLPSLFCKWIGTIFILSPFVSWSCTTMPLFDVLVWPTSSLFMFIWYKKNLASRHHAILADGNAWKLSADCACTSGTVNNGRKISLGNWKNVKLHWRTCSRRCATFSFVYFSALDLGVWEIKYTFHSNFNKQNNKTNPLNNEELARICNGL